ncbi:MAG: Gfo/Idh/MocA family oxidoreductase [Lentisphaeria bacterium]|nr:Gfo/Idh/MocA family oxidoreductase [Lentisphaeria bacterium]
MATQKNIRFGAIGCGNAGTHRIRLLAGNALGLDVVAAADVNPSRLDNLADVLGYDFERYTGAQDYQRMIDENDLDAVGIFTPHTLHYEHVVYAIEAGKHVLIEKPMVCGAAKAMEVTRMLEKQGTIGIVHYQRHYMAPFHKARELIRKGKIGEVTGFFVYMAQDWPGREWRGDPEFSGGGQLNDSGSHYQDILLWMTDLLPKSAEGNLDNYYQGDLKKVEVNGSFNVELSNGAAGRILILGDILGGFCDDVRIRGTKGDLMMSTFHGERLLLRDNATNKIEDIPLSMPKGYPACPCDNFVKLIRKKVKINRVPFIFGVRVATLTDCMLTAARTGRKVTCDELLAEAGASLKDLA